MTDKHAGETPSTTWAWRKIKITPSHPSGDCAPKALHSASNGRRKRLYRDRLMIEVWWRGGPEDDWIVRIAGRSARRIPGWMCLTDVVSLVVQEANRGS